MALPVLLQKLFKSSGYGPELNDEIVSRHISVQDWSNAYDYPVNTLARGSDGLLYWSVAQSGPGVAAGAQDPTADDGTYWQAPYAKTMPPLASSAAAATTKWVRDAVCSAELYVDPASGNDGRDGLTAATAVQTIARALSILENRTSGLCRIYLAGGTYQSQVSVSSKKIIFSLLGNVILSDGLDISYNSFVQIDSSSYSLTVSKQSDNVINVDFSSCFYCLADLSLNATNVASVLRSAGNSVVVVGKTDINCNTVSRVFLVRGNAFLNLTGNVTVTGTSVTYGIRVEIGSTLIVHGNVSIPLPATIGLVATSGSNVLISSGIVEVHGSSAVGACIVEASSELFIESGGTLKIVHSGSTNNNSSALYIAGVSNLYADGVLDISSTSSIAAFIRCTNGSCISFSAAGQKLNGIISRASVYLFANSCLTVDSSTTFTASTVTGTGNRYELNVGCVLYSSSKGNSFIPGPAGTTGTVSNGSFYV